MSIDKSTYRTIFLSLLSSALFYIFLRPILTLIWGWLVDAQSVVSVSVINAAYKNAALGDRNWVVVQLATLVFSCITGIMVFSCTYLGKTLRSAGKKIQEINTPPHLVDEIVPRDERIRNYKKRHKALKCIYWFTVFMVSVSILCVLFLLMCFDTDLQLNSSFSQRLTVLTPKVSQQTISELRAEWAQMRTRQDYLQIVERMNALASAAQVKLPEPLVK